MVQYSKSEHTHTIHYDDGDVESLDLLTETYREISRPTVSSKKLVPWLKQIRDHVATLFEGEAVEDTKLDGVVELLGAALSDGTIGNYKGKVARFIRFCAAQRPPRQPLPANKAIALLYMQDLSHNSGVQLPALHVCGEHLSPGLGF